MTSIVIFALVSISVFYIFISTQFKNKSLGDFLPTSKSQHPYISDSGEFSSSTTASTISLVTVILAMFEASSWFGVWLLWSVLTTTFGIIIVHYFSERIWDKLSIYKDHIPTLHEFLSIEFNSPSIRKVSALMTSLGFLGAFAVELTVGSLFLSRMMPEIPQLFTAVFLASIGLIYTYLGGFRAVIKTDKYQMISIWIMIISLSLFFVWNFTFVSSWSSVKTNVPVALYDFSYKDGLYAAMVGIFLVNVPIYLSDMSIWQRISGTKSKSTLQKGLARSVASVSVSWTMLVILSLLLIAMALPTENNVNPLFILLQHISTLGTLGTALLFIISIGLFGAMLSTASTQLIASTHAFHLDVLKKSDTNKIDNILDSDLKRTRKILLSTGFFAIIVVYFFILVEFSIVDLVFAVFGAQLGLFPAVYLALFCSKESNQKIKTFIPWAISLGFLSGWGSAIYGQVFNYPELVFLSPAFALSISVLIIAFAWLFTQLK